MATNVTQKDKPLFGNKQPNRTGTHWIVFMKEDAK